MDLSIPREIFWVELTAEQKAKIKAGESVLVKDMISKNTGNKFSARVSLNDGHLDLKMVSDAPQRLLGVSLSEELRERPQNSGSVLVKGMTSKAGKSFDANISLNPEKGIVFDFNNQKQEVQIEKKQPEFTLRIPFLDDSAYRGNLKNNTFAIFNAIQSNVVLSSILLLLTIKVGFVSVLFLGTVLGY